MKMTTRLLLMALLLAGAADRARAQGTRFSYQGRLHQNGNPATGLHDLRFTIYNAGTNGGVVAGPLTQSAVGVTNGLFTATLDFGANVFTGPDRWMEIAVRTNGAASFVTLAPRQPLLPAPYAIHAGSASNVANGAVVKSLNNLRDNVTLAAGPNVTLTPSGNTLTIASTGGAGVWSLNGANTYFNSGNVGIGSATPNHRLRLSGGPSWTANGWRGALEMDNASALGWQANAAGNRFGLGQSGGGLYFFATASDPGNAASPANYLMMLDDSGNVGVGTLAPEAKLDVAGTIHASGKLQIDTQDALGITGFQPFITLIDSSVPGQFLTPARRFIQVVNGDMHFTYRPACTSIPCPPVQGHLTLRDNGNVGIGTATPTTKLEVAGDVMATRLVMRADPAAPANATVLCNDSNVVNFVPYNTVTARPLNLVVRDATVHALTITGGADIAEPFQMSSEEVPKGSVVVIDEKNPGRLKLSSQPYDTRVAGIVSGANGINPGLSLHQQGAIEGGENVALSGRVYVRADASTGAIQPGDLLTTSATPGHAMKAGDPARAQGAILGKAMTALADGQGMVLVLVTLQ